MEVNASTSLVQTLQSCTMYNQRCLACPDYETLKESLALMLHEPLKPAANCLSGGLIGKQKQRSCRCFNWCSQSSPVGLHGFDSSCSQCPDGRGQCYCHLHSVGAAASQGAPAGARVSKQLEPCREKAFPSSWSWIPAVCGR